MKALAGQTAIYGLSSILGRMINFLLVPLQTAVLTQAEYGINVDFYSLIAFLIVICTFGMETAYFRYSEQEDLKSRSVRRGGDHDFNCLAGISPLLSLDRGLC